MNPDATYQQTQPITKPRNPIWRTPNAETLTTYLFILPCMVGFAVFFLFPTLRGLWISTTNWNLLRAPSSVGLENYQRMLNDPAFWNALKTTFIYVIINISIRTLLGLFLVVAMDRLTKSMLVRGGLILPDLFRLRGRTALMAATACIGLLLAGVAVTRAGLPTWGETLIFLGVIAVPASLKWRDDLVAWGTAACVLSVLLALQGFHTVEHIVQLVQFYVLNRPGIQSQGLISSLNVEWVHFIWSWLAWGCVVHLVRNGMKGVWGYWPGSRCTASSTPTC